MAGIMRRIDTLELGDRIGCPEHRKTVTVTKAPKKLVFGWVFFSTTCREQKEHTYKPDVLVEVVAGKGRVRR